MAEAEQIYRQILAIDCRHPDCLHLLGMIAYDAGRHQAAVDLIRRAIAINKNGASYHSNLGTVLRAQGMLDQAADCYIRALALRPELAEIHTNLGNIRTGQGRIDESLACYQRALALMPESADARYNMGVAQLLKGDFASGWRNFEMRWQTKDFGTPMRSYSQPLWNGQRLSSGRLLLWREQGVGDEIMFAGMIPDVMRTGTRCVLDCDPRLVPLFARSFPSIEVMSGVDPKDCPELDMAAHLPSGNLPTFFRPTEDKFAATTSPYLVADEKARERFRASYGYGKRLIGLAWHTNNRTSGRYRSIDLSLLAPLLARRDIRWVSLQYGDHEDLEKQVTRAEAPVLIDRSVDQFSNIDRFAAQIAAMDMVITIDNSTAHLAGALGVPTLVLLPFAPDWRWRQTGENSLWYTSLRLFRQPKPGDWQAVVQSVQSAL